MADIDWSGLFHAYGRASDTPGHLLALAGDDEEARGAAVDHLWAAVIHQGTAWSATPPAALVVAGLLSDPRTHDASLPSGSEPRPLRVDLLGFLGAVAEAARPDIPEDEVRAAAFPAGRGEEEVAAALRTMLADDDAWGEDVGEYPDHEDEEDEEGEEEEGEEEVWDEELTSALLARVVLDIRAVAPALYEPVLSCLDDADLRVRTAAVGTLAALALIPGVVDRPAEVVGRLEEAARLAAGHDERAVLVLALGELGAAPREFLADPHPAVRACAALAPALDGDAAAAREVLSALADPAAADSWLSVRPRQLSGHLRFALVATAIRRAGSFEELLPAALGVAAMTTQWTVDSDWGPLLAAAFPEPLTASGSLTGAQRSYLEALVANDDLWSETAGNPLVWFKNAGLTYDRAACRALLAGSTGSAG